MARITEMNRQNIERISEDAEVALQIVAEEYGLILNPENGSYDRGRFTTKWTFVCETEDGVPADFVRDAPFFGLTKEDYGRTFQADSKTFTLCGLKPRSPKYPILGRDVQSGQVYKFSRTVLEDAAQVTVVKITG